jgi:hypothetical protein
VVINHRTSLLSGEEGQFPEVWAWAKQYFPRWIGFSAERCSYEPVLADRIRRIRRVASRGIERFFANPDPFGLHEA